MAQPANMQSLQDLFAYPFQDARWKEKFLTGSIFAFLGIILAPTIVLAFIPGIFLYGYFARIMRPVIVERSRPSLPEWDEWDDLAQDGLKLAVVVFVYLLPFLMLFILAYGFMFAVPVLGGLMEEAGAESSPLFLVISLVGPMGFMALFALSMLGFLFLGLLLPAVIGHVVAADDLGAAFRFGDWWAVFRANLGGFLLAYVLLMGVWMVLGFLMNFLYLTFIFCCLIPFVLSPISVYLLAVSAALFGEAYRLGADRIVSTPASPPERQEVEPWEVEPEGMQPAASEPTPKETIALSAEDEPENTTAQPDEPTPKETIVLPAEDEPESIAAQPDEPAPKATIALPPEEAPAAQEERSETQDEDG